MIRLVGDVGGTNTRIGLCHDGQLNQNTIKSFVNNDWDSLNSILVSFCQSLVSQPNELVIGVAGLVTETYAKVTNRNWFISKDALTQEFNGARVSLLNDLMALGYAVPQLKEDQFTKVNPQKVQQVGNRRALVVGIGTGFNVSPVSMTSAFTVCLPAEAGHVSMPNNISKSLLELAVNSSDFPTVETLFSGRGFAKFCAAYTDTALSDGETIISSFGMAGSETLTEATQKYAALLGQLLTEMSLSYTPTDGIYLAGSVARAIVGVASGDIIAAMTRPSVLESENFAAMRIINDDSAALVGCGLYTE